MTTTTGELTRNPFIPAGLLDPALIAAYVKAAGIDMSTGQAGGGTAKAEIGTPGTSTAYAVGNNADLYPLVLGPGGFVDSTTPYLCTADLSLGHHDAYGDEPPLWTFTADATEREVADKIIEIYDWVTSRWQFPNHYTARGTWCRFSLMGIGHPGKWADGNSRCLHDCPGSEAVRIG